MIRRLPRGRLTALVNIQSRSRTRDAHGGTSDAWSTDTNGAVRALIQPASGTEGATASMLTADATHLVTIDYYSSLTSEKRFLFGSRILNIALVKNLEERNLVHQCECRESAK